VVTITVTKRSVRRLVKLKRLPRQFRMLVVGSWLYDLLEANRLHEKFHLWSLRYWVRLRSLDSRHMAVSWRDDK
jgi:hypothetical protein